MDKKLLKRFLKGWDEVARVEEVELLSLSPRMKFRQVLAVFKLGVDLGMTEDPATVEELLEVRSRWCVLKAGY